MKITVEDIYRKCETLANDGFTGEAVVRFAGSVHEGFFTLHKDIHKDTHSDNRPNQDMSLVMSIYFMLRHFGAFGAITMIWYDGHIKNFTIKLTFQGLDTQILAQSIFQNVK